METLRSRSGREALRKEDPYEQRGGKITNDVGGVKRKLRGQRSNRLKNEQIDMRYFWTFLGLLAIAVFTFAYVNGRHPELQSGEAVADFVASGRVASSSSGVHWASLNKLRARRAGFWPFISGTGDEDLDELGDLITQMEEANKGYKRSAQLYSEEGPREEGDLSDWRTGSEVAGKGGEKRQETNGEGERKEVGGEVRSTGSEEGQRLEKGGSDSTQKGGPGIVGEGESKSGGVVSNEKGESTSLENGKSILIQNGESVSTEKKGGSDSSAGLFFGRKVQQTLELSAVEPRKKAEQSLGDSTGSLESIDLETNDEGRISDLRIRGAGKAFDGRSLSGVHKPRTRTEAHAKNYWVSRHMLSDDIKDHVTYDDVAGRQGRRVLAERGQKAQPAKERTTSEQPVDWVEKGSFDDVSVVESDVSGEQSGGSESKGLESVFTRFHKAVGLIGDQIGLTGGDGGSSKTAQSEMPTGENDGETTKRDLYLKGRTALGENGETILVPPMEVEFEEGLGGLELALPSDVRAAKMPPRVLHQARMRPRVLSSTPQAREVRVPSKFVPLTPPQESDRESVFEEGSGGLHVLEDPAEKEPAESTEQSNQPTESLRIQSVESTDDLTASEGSLEDKTNGAWTEKAAESGGKATEAERSVEARFAKARAIRNARNENGAGTK